jgi:hypothetical protein
MFESIINATNLQKGFFVMATGIVGVFIVLVLFFFLIKCLQLLFPAKDNE